MIVGPSVVVSLGRARRLWPELLRLVHREGAVGAAECLALVDELAELLRAVDAAHGDRALLVTDDTPTVDTMTAARVLGLARRTVTGHCATGRLNGRKVNGQWRVQLPG